MTALASRCQARLQRHGATLGRTATARQAAAPATTEAGSNPCPVHGQRSIGVLIGHNHDVIAAVVQRRSATARDRHGVHDTSIR
jgi:hypothetical protein